MFGKLEKRRNSSTISGAVAAGQNSRRDRWLDVASAATLIKRADKDGDGALTREELRAAAPPTRPAPRKRDPADRSTGDRPRRDDAEPGGESTDFRSLRAGLFEVLDADGDGRLSGAELDGAGDALRKLDGDGDGDGAVDRAEVFKLLPTWKKGDKLPLKRP